MYQSVTVLQYVHVLLIFCCCTYSHCHCLSDWVCLQSTQLVITQPFHLPLSWISRHMYIRLYQSLSHYFVCLYVENCWRVLYASGCVSAAFVCLWVSKLCEVTEAFITDCAVKVSQLEQNVTSDEQLSVNSCIVVHRPRRRADDCVTLHYITVFSAGPTTTRTGPAIQVSTIILKTKTMNVKSRYVNVKKSESSAGDETLWWNWQFAVTQGESSRHDPFFVHCDTQIRRIVAPFLRWSSDDCIFDTTISNLSRLGTGPKYGMQHSVRIKAWFS